MDLNDRKAWDDAELINTWDEALEEYKKYHSIHLSGKRLEDVLTKEEMIHVHAQRRALRQGTQNRAPKNGQDEGEDEDEDVLDENQDEDERDMSISPERDIPIEVAFEETPAQADTTTGTEPKTTTNGTSAAPMLPQMPLTVGVQDENLKSLLMAWYYAGYHTGLYEGRQQAIKELGVESKT